MDMFKVPNKAGFEVIVLFLFQRLNPTRAKEEFRDCWPVRDKRSEQTFRRVCNGWLLQIAQDEADAHLPKIVPSIFQSPGGERFCNLMFAFSSYVLSTVIKNEHGVKSNDMLLKPVLTPQNLEFSSAMVQAAQCMVIDNRKKFFDRIHTRGALHKTWQKSASEMLTEYRRLNRSIRQSEANIKSLLSSHSGKGFASPVRMDRSKKPLTPASKHGKVFDVNIQSVRREEKVQKVRDLWCTVEVFLAASSTHQEVVSSILSGVVHKYILRASELDLRVPEMLLRECERELLKRDIGNTYKAGQLDLVSILNLWNLSMHLYLERFEESDTIDLSKQLKDLQPKIHAQNEQLASCRQLGSSLRDELIPELKESIQQMKKKVSGFEYSQPTGRSKLGMSLQPNSPPLIFDPNQASAADLEATKMTFTPDMFPQESTPDAVSRIMKSVSQAVKPRRLVNAEDKENQTPAGSKGVPQGTALSPLAQGKVRRARKGEYFDSTVNSEGSLSRSVLSPQHKQQLQDTVEVSRVGSKQVTKVVRVEQQASPNRGVFSPSEEGSAWVDNSITERESKVVAADSNLPVRRRLAQPAAVAKTLPAAAKSSFPGSTKHKKRPAGRAPMASALEREAALDRLYSQVESLPSPPLMGSPSDVLAARIAQSILEDGDMDSPSLNHPNVSATAGNSSNNVLEELGVSGFVRRDKIARTPDTIDNSKNKGYSLLSSPSLSKQQSTGVEKLGGREIFATPQRPAPNEVLSEEDVEDEIITVQGQEMPWSASSSDADEEDNFKADHNIADTVLSNISSHRQEVKLNASKSSGKLRGDNASDGASGMNSSARNQTTMIPSEMTLKDFVCWTPEKSSIGKMIMASVLDEEPLFIDSPVAESYDNLDDLAELLPPDNPFGDLQNSSGFIPSWPNISDSMVGRSSEKTRNPRLTNLSESSEDEPATKADATPQLTMEELMLRLQKLKDAAVHADKYNSSGVVDEIDQLLSLQEDSEPDGA